MLRRITLYFSRDSQRHLSDLEIVIELEFSGLKSIFALSRMTFVILCITYKYDNK